MYTNLKANILNIIIFQLWAELKMQNTILDTIINQKFFTKMFLKNLGMITNSIFNWTEAVIETCNKDIAGVQVRVWHPE